MKIFYNLFLVFILFLLSACGKKIDPRSLPVPVEIQTLQYQTLLDTEEYLAKLESREAVDLFPRVSAQVQNILVMPGQKVTKGTLLIKLEASAQQSAVASRQYGSSASQSYFASSIERQKAAMSDFKLAENQYERQKKLYAEDLISKNTLDEYLNKYENAKNNYQASSADVQKASQETKQARSMTGEESAYLGYYLIRAPFSGTVGNIPVKIGDYVSPNTKLLEVANVNNLELALNLPTEKARHIKEKSNISIMDEEKTEIKACEVFFISPVVDSDTQTVLVKARCDNSDHILRTNEEVTTKIQWGVTQGFLIPPSALVRYANNYFVYIAIPNKKKKNTYVAKQLSVNLGQLQDNNYQILGGLEEGQLLIIQGVEKLRDGMLVQRSKNGL